MRLVSYVYTMAMLVILVSTTASSQTIIECPANQLDLSKVDFTADNCNESSLQNYSMSDRSVWLSLTLPIADNLLNSQHPVGLFISGRMSTRVYINGVRIGEKGVPGLEADKEVAGELDWVGYVPRTVLNATSNQITMHISSFQNHWPRIYPISNIYFDTYRASTNDYLLHYLPTLIPLGAMLLSLIYLLRRMLLEPKAPNLAYLLILTLAATLQLAIEVFRGFYAYSYPFHDTRLAIIWFFAFIFGQALLAQSLNQFTQMKKRIPIAVCLGLILIVKLIVLDPDLQTTYSIQIPATLAACFIAFEQYHSKGNQYVPSIVLFAFSLLIMIAPYNFLDTYLYYCIAALLAYLFTYEAQSKVKQQNELALEKQRAEKLQLALEMKTQETTAQTITLKDSGKIIMIGVENILFCQGAGDYVDVVLPEETILHSGSLSHIITELPSYFIKVHRSYLVNAKHIAHMRRLPSGTGEIELVSGHVIPVSRRLMPKLKETLGG